MCSFLKVTGRIYSRFFSSDLLAVFGILGYRYTTSTSAVFTWFSLLCAFVSAFPLFTRTSDVLDQGPIPVGLIECSLFGENFL